MVFRETQNTDVLCQFLTLHGFDSRHQQSYSPGICDIVSALPGGIEVWIEAKLYWTLWFKNGTTLAEAHSGEHYSRKIEAIVTDCSTKLAIRPREPGDRRDRGPSDRFREDLPQTNDPELSQPAVGGHQ